MVRKSDAIRETAVLLVSGGMDSLVAAAVGMQSYRPAFLHVSYGQKTEARERRSFYEIISYYRAEQYRVLDCRWLGELKGSSLTDRLRPVPHDPEHDRVLPSTYVPFRNSILISAAVAYAEVIGATAIIYGAVESDRTGYPDCRQSYLEAFNELILQGCSPASHITIQAPLITKTKAEIVRLGSDLNVPFQFTWSCYQDSDLACGSCDSCLLRREAFQKAGVTDPVPYRS